ncbi:phenylalanine--tRNA ligase subunit beta [Rubrobacter taiwanensis]|uniref:Phenylalanine--tRNA ligase beta subunit n=1 Tax=Rubrobacter taiwanensis TaxID=185139 RepID=A0A4R1BHH7_9ACTN|nr:phenylalanine--tRNA ligase subunit beta [Rubrobacter taiwanensis]TCJ16736.1 phenylalanine--tRNA ligase subunit beta [Rubrobacter taiwanensis]
MRVPLSWLREYVDFDQSPEELVSLLSLRSQEVEGVYRYGVADGEVVVGEVQEFGRHPNADRLFVGKVDIGGRVVQIVAGASNPYPGARVPVVLPGSVMADGTKLKKARLRGLESYGMMMSERELGISNDHEGILLLEGDYEVGRPLADYFPVGEVVLDVDVMPNRPDLWGMIGVARELAAILRTDFRVPEVRFRTGGAPTGEYTLRVEDEDLCPRYDLRRVSGMRPGVRAPIWMRRRVFTAGMRPINGIVDATNYVMLETGQPIHAFDARRIVGGIVVRRARPGERLALIDGSVRELDGEMLVIADEERGRAIAGVMGGEDSEVEEGTTDVLVEVATFAGRNILETSARLGLRTDASGRFERGLDPNMVGFARDRVVQLLAANCGGWVAPDVLSHYPEPVEPRSVPLRPERAELLLGMPVDREEAAELLASLGCEVAGSDGRLEVVVPTFRRDLEREADLIEEIGRLKGLEHVPEELPAIAEPGGLAPEQQRERLVRRTLADLGFAEAILYPFGPDRWVRDLLLPEGDPRHRTVRLRNPLSGEQAELRTTLLPGMLDAAARNRAFGVRGGALFEVGRVFLAREIPAGQQEYAVAYRLQGRRGLEPVAEELFPGRPLEELKPGELDFLSGVEELPKVGGLLAGEVRPQAWNAPAVSAGFFEAKGVVERLVPDAEFEPVREPFLHPGRSARVLAGGEAVGWVGEVHPQVVESFGLGSWPVAAFELSLWHCDPDRVEQFRRFVNVPAVEMDLAVVVDEGVRAGDMLRAISEVESPILAGFRIFDVYAGRQVPEGKKSVAFSFTFQGEETLTDERVKRELDRIAARLGESFGAQVRRG